MCPCIYDRAKADLVEYKIPDKPTVYELEARGLVRRELHNDIMMKVP